MFKIERNRNEKMQFSAPILRPLGYDFQAMSVLWVNIPIPDNLFSTSGQEAKVISFQYVYFKFQFNSNKDCR